jgi:HAD superfamily hydrolase (TIGR01490 family)
MNRPGMVAAFFDLDGTVIAPPSLEFRFAVYLARRGELRGGAVFSWLRVLLNAAMKALATRGGMRARLKVLDENKSYLARVREQAAAEWAKEHIGAIECHEDALARIEWHREQGHAIFFVSGTLAPLARAVAKRIARGREIGVVATELQSAVGLWTGHTAGAAVCGVAKVRALRDLAARYEIDLTRSYAYGDSLADHPMLAAVGNATAVNPGTRLNWLARRRGWRIVRWPRREFGLEITPEGVKQRIARWEKS